MKTTYELFDQFQKSNPTSQIMSMVNKPTQILRFYSNLYNIDRLEVALLEEGIIDTDATAKFIAELKETLLTETI